jgi:hypothetical protein
VRVVINGAVQIVHFLGGRSSGQTQGSFGPVDGTDSCDPLRVKVVVPNEPTRATDEIEVSDGTTTLRAEFPNVLTPVSFRQAPPSIVARGDVFHVSLQPPTTAGTGEYDAGNFVRASLNSTYASSASTTIPIRGISASDFEITIPKGTPPGATKLFLSSAQSAVPAKVCSASFCRAEQTFVLTSALTIR